MEARVCANIRGKRHPHSRCSLVATHGEFCSRHWRNPIRWTAQPTLRASNSSSSLQKISSPRVNRKQSAAATRIQKFWRWRGNLRLARRHGPAYFQPQLSANSKEICTLDSIDTIPSIYRISYIDDQHHMWTFDIRFLIQSMTYESTLKNPFTQSAYPPQFLDRLEQIVDWLKCRKFPIVYVERDILTADQAWNQKILTVLLKYHALGYTIQSRWFEQLSKEEHIMLYQRLFLQWFFGPIAAERDRIVPDWDNPSNRLFRWPIDYAASLKFKTIHWWRKVSLSILDTLVSSSEEKTLRTSGALFAMLSFVHVCASAAESYSYLL